MSRSDNRDPVSPAAMEFFARLRALTFGPEKPDPQENRLDVLELVAVYVGVKPAHLQGQGQYDAGTLAEIETIASEAGLLTRRTGELPNWTHRPYAGDGDYWEWSHSSGADGHELLWVYRNETSERAIEAVLAGTAGGVGSALGYPSCCETEHSEEILLVSEAMERGFRDEHGAATTEDLIRLAREDRPVAVDLDFEMGGGLRRTMQKYPFIQFTACARCLRNRGSRAARVNDSLRRLARELDRAFAREIARYGSR